MELRLALSGAANFAWVCTFTSWGLGKGCSGRLLLEGRLLRGLARRWPIARWLAGRRPLAWIGHELGRRGHRRHGVVLRLEQLVGLVARVEHGAAAHRRRGALRGLGTYVVRLLRQLLSGCGRALSARRPITGRRRAALVSGLENGQE